MAFLLRMMMEGYLTKLHHANVPLFFLSFLSFSFERLYKCSFSLMIWRVNWKSNSVGAQTECNQCFQKEKKRKEKKGFLSIPGKEEEKRSN